MVTRPNESGTALILAMITMVIVMGMVLTTTILMQNSANQSELQVDYERSIISAESGLNASILLARATEIVEKDIGGGDELVGFVGVETDSGSFDTRTISGVIDGIAYTARVRSAYLAHHASNPSQAATSYLAALDKTTHEGDPDVFDYYEITIATQPVGRHDLRRGVQAVYKIRRRDNGSDAVPSPLYIETDDDLQLNGNSFTLSGDDHWMVPPTTSDASSVLDLPDELLAGIMRDVEASGALACTIPDLNPLTSAILAGSNDTGGAGNESDFIRTDVDANPVPALGYGGESADSTDADADNDGQPDVFDNIDLPKTPGDQIYTTIDGTKQSGYDATTFVQMSLDELVERFTGGLDSNGLPIRKDVVVADGKKDLSSNMGSKDSFQTSFITPDAQGKITLSGQLEGGGVLIVNGDLHISGKMTFYGIVIVLGEINVTGGGNADTHVFGSALAKKLGHMTGNADVWWSSQAVEKAFEELADAAPAQPLVSPIVWRSLDKAQIEAMGL